MQTTREDLEVMLARTAKGDRAAFESLYRATSVKLFGIVFRILRQRDTGEEILQEVYVRIWNRAGDFQPGRASPITWMAAIARNRALDEARRRVPQIADGVDLPDIADETPSAADRLEHGADLKRLETCLDGLEADRSAMVRLAYLDGLSRQALADRFGQPVDTIKTWLHRSLKQLKDCLGS